jgi:hypothetical protein
MSDEDKTPPEGLRAVCVSTANAVAELDQVVAGHGLRLVSLERGPRPSKRHTVTIFVLGIVSGLWLARLVYVLTGAQ